MADTRPPDQVLYAFGQWLQQWAEYALAQAELYTASAAPGESAGDEPESGTPAAPARAQPPSHWLELIPAGPPAHWLALFEEYGLEPPRLDVPRNVKPDDPVPAPAARPLQEWLSEFQRDLAQFAQSPLPFAPEPDSVRPQDAAPRRVEVVQTKASAADTASVSDKAPEEGLLSSQTTTDEIGPVVPAALAAEIQSPSPSLTPEGSATTNPAKELSVEDLVANNVDADDDVKFREVPRGSSEPVLDQDRVVRARASDNTQIRAVPEPLHPVEPAAPLAPASQSPARGTELAQARQDAFTPADSSAERVKENRPSLPPLNIKPSMPVAFSSPSKRHEEPNRTADTVSKTGANSLLTLVSSPEPEGREGRSPAVRLRLNLSQPATEGNIPPDPIQPSWIAQRPEIHPSAGAPPEEALSNVLTGHMDSADEVNAGESSPPRNPGVSPENTPPQLDLDSILSLLRQKEDAPRFGVSAQIPKEESPPGWTRSAAAHWPELPERLPVVRPPSNVLADSIHRMRIDREQRGKPWNT